MRSATSTTRSRVISALATVVLSVVMVSGAIALPAVAANKTRLVTGLAGGSGSTVGPDGGALRDGRTRRAVSRGSIRRPAP